MSLSSPLQQQQEKGVSAAAPASMVGSGKDGLLRLVNVD